MAYDERLAERIRDLLDDAEVTEQKMFGGLAFLIGGNMAVAASGQGGLMVRVDPTKSETLVTESDARPMEMRGSPVRGWLRVDTAGVRTKRELARWVNMGVAYARSLPAKRCGGDHPPGRRKDGLEILELDDHVDVRAVPTTGVGLLVVEEVPADVDEGVGPAGGGAPQ